MKKFLFSNVVLLASTFALCSAAYADLLIGIGAPFSGPYAAFGTQIQKGVEAAVVEINDAGGLHGEKIKIVLGDDGFERQKALSVARKFVTDGVTFVIGHYNSDFFDTCIKDLCKERDCYDDPRINAPTSNRAKTTDHFPSNWPG